MRRLTFLFQRFHRSTPARRALVIEAFFLLLWAKAALKLVQFSALSKSFGVFVKPDDPRAGIALTPGAGTALAREIGWAVQRVALRAPFTAVCLPQAMAAHRMLARRGVPSVMHLGARANMQTAADTHAWLNAAGVEVTGYPITDFTEIGCFVPNG